MDDAVMIWLAAVRPGCTEEEEVISRSTLMGKLNIPKRLPHALL